MKPSAPDSGIRAIFLLRRIGSIFVVSIIFILFASDGYHRIRERLRISDLKDIYKDGVSQLATVEEKYKIVYNGYKPQLTFNYSFTEEGKTFKSKYTLFQALPEDSYSLTKIFTVHYLKDNPDKNSLNIEDEIKRIEKNIEESSTFWFVVKIIATLLFALILLMQILALISEIRNMNKPIEIPDYLKK